MKTKRTFSARASALVISFALLFMSLPTAAAVANEITSGVDTYSYVSGASTHSIVFELATGNLAAGDIIDVTFPDTEFPVNATQTAVVDLAIENVPATYDADVTTTVTSTTTVDSNSQNHYSIVLGAALTTGTPTWVRITGLTTGETSEPIGQYAMHISTFDSAATTTVVETGTAMLSNDNSFSVTAVVDEALIMTIDAAAINLRVDPSVNAGIDQTQSSTLTVSTNSVSYTISSSLTNTNKLCLDGTCAANAEITSATSGENTFAFNTTAAGAGDTAFGSNVVTAANGYTNSTGHTIYYDLDVDYTIKAGTYTGTITYTATPTF
ncbi:hypothetical protein KKF38_02340 [Patescibacteria group bacterium]|nr:hypothetical protein [Patescibacteria group bacterium]